MPKICYVEKRFNDRQLVAACKVYYGDTWGFVDAEAMRVAINTALLEPP